MPIPSNAEPRPHSVVGSQLVRRWQPATTVRAEVVLVHGIAEHCGRYERTAGLLADAGLAVTAADLVGFGATGGRRGYVEEWSWFLDQVEQLMAETRQTGRPVVLLGASMGGLIALDYALSDRARPDLLVLSAPGLKGGAAWQRKAAPLLGLLTPYLAVPNRLKGEQLSRDPAVGEAYFADPLVLKRSTAKLGSEMFAAMDRINTSLGNLDVPTLVLHGGSDTIVPPTATVELGNLPGVERRLYRKLRHELFNEPEGPKVVADVIGWIDERLNDA